MLDDFSHLIDKDGMVNFYKEDVNIGSQPVRVLHHLLIAIFQESYPDFNKELYEQIGKGALNPEINISHTSDPVSIEKGVYRTPRINLKTRQIELHESFLSFLWSSIYSIYVLFVETIDYPRCNRNSLFKKYPISKSNIDNARNLFVYSKFLIAHYEEWDKKQLPNPEYYHPNIHNYIWQVNSLYCYAITFILCHEFTHIKYHVSKLNHNISDSERLWFEKEADTNAMEMLKKGFIKGYSEEAVAQRLIVVQGIILGMLSMFFLSDKTSGIIHPNLEDRLANVLENFPLEDEELAWEIACLGLQMWDTQFNLQFNWNENDPPKTQFYEIIEQIRKRNV